MIGLSIYSCNKDPKSKLYNNETIQLDTIGFSWEDQVLINSFIEQHKNKIDKNSMSYNDVILYQDSVINQLKKMMSIIWRQGKTYTKDVIIRGDTLYLNKKDMSRFTGNLYITYSDFLGRCINGIQEGEWSVGNIKKNYYNGKLHGPYLSYRSSNRDTLESKGNYKHGVRDGNLEFYFTNGQLRCVINYKNGEEIGFRKYYHEKNGQLKGQTKILRDKFSMKKIYDDNGVLIGEGYDYNGETDSLWRYYHNNGQLQMIGNYIKGKKEGLWKSYYDDGTLHLEQQFENDIEI